MQNYQDFLNRLRMTSVRHQTSYTENMDAAETKTNNNQNVPLCRNSALLSLQTTVKNSSSTIP